MFAGGSIKVDLVYIQHARSYRKSPGQAEGVNASYLYDSIRRSEGDQR